MKLNGLHITSAERVAVQAHMTQPVVVTCSMKEVFIGIGIELGYLIGLPCVSVVGGWRITFGMALIFVLIMKAGMVSFHAEYTDVRAKHNQSSSNQAWRLRLPPLCKYASD